LKQFSYNPLDPLYELFGNFTHGGVGGTKRPIPSALKAKLFYEAFQLNFFDSRTNHVNRWSNTLNYYLVAEKKIDTKFAIPIACLPYLLIS
jgi:hypothetical protein